MTEEEFAAARKVAKLTSRPDTSFALLVALITIAPELPVARLAKLLRVQPSALSLVAAELDALNILRRHYEASTAAARPGYRPRHGRTRMYTLANGWLNSATALPDPKPTIRRRRSA